MRNDVLIYLNKDIDYYIYLRENPLWYKKLNRDPRLLRSFLDEYKTRRRKRIIDKIEDITLMINLAKELT